MAINISMSAPHNLVMMKVNKVSREKIKSVGEGEKLAQSWSVHQSAWTRLRQFSAMGRRAIAIRPAVPAKLCCKHNFPNFGTNCIFALTLPPPRIRNPAVADHKAPRTGHSKHPEFKSRASAKPSKPPLPTRCYTQRRFYNRMSACKGSNKS